MVCVHTHKQPLCIVFADNDRPATGSVAGEVGPMIAIIMDTSMRAPLSTVVIGMSTALES